MKTIVLVSAALLAAAPAFAQSNAPRPFDGPFVGVQGGWQQDRQRLETTDSTGFVGSYKNNTEGFSYGGQVGYDFNAGNNLVLGVEAALTGRTGHDDYVDQFNNPYTLKSGRTITATARVGTLLNPYSLLYVRGGYANARFTIDDNFGRYSQDRDGWTLGVGYEQAITRNVSARIEYNYSDFGHDNLGDYATGAGFTSASNKYTRHNVSAGLNLRF
jgi:outer membrane immunogenic protein